MINISNSCIYIQPCPRNIFLVNANSYPFGTVFLLFLLIFESKSYNLILFAELVFLGYFSRVVSWRFSGCFCTDLLKHFLWFLISNECWLENEGILLQGAHTKFVAIILVRLPFYAIFRLIDFPSDPFYFLPSKTRGGHSVTEQLSDSLTPY